MSCDAIKRFTGSPTRSDTMRPAQSQKQARGLESFVFKKKRHCTIYVAKKKVLISCAVTAQLICSFVFRIIQEFGFLMMQLKY